MTARHFTATAALVATAMLAGCQNDYMEYDSSLRGVYFTRDTLEYSFGVTPIETQTYLLKVPFRTMGIVADTDRTVNFEIVADSTDATEGVQFTLGEARIEAGQTEGYVPVTLLRSGLEGTYATGYRRYRLGLRLKSNEHFTPILNAKDQLRVVRFDNAIEQPRWMGVNNEKIWPSYNLGVWHPYKLIKMVELFHGLEATMPETYQRIADLYGENLESIPYGDPYIFKTIFNKYIFKPMYDYFSDPANHDAIISAYPDFPFDMPNPYA